MEDGGDARIMIRNPHLSSKPHAEAAVWFVHLSSASPSSAVKEEFSTWLHLSPENVAAYRDIAETFGTINKVNEESEAFKVERIRVRSTRLTLPPGFRINRLSQFLLTRKAHQRYVAPVIADMQEEYFQEISATRFWHARWIAIRGHLLILPGWLYAALARAIRYFNSK